MKSTSVSGGCAAVDSCLCAHYEERGGIITVITSQLRNAKQVLRGLSRAHRTDTHRSVKFRGASLACRAGDARLETSTQGDALQQNNNSQQPPEHEAGSDYQVCSNKRRPTERAMTNRDRN